MRNILIYILFLMLGYSQHCLAEKYFGFEPKKTTLKETIKILDSSRSQYVFGRFFPNVTPTLIITNSELVQSPVDGPTMLTANIHFTPERIMSNITITYKDKDLKLFKHFNNYYKNRYKPKDKMYQNESWKFIKYSVGDNTIFLFHDFTEHKTNVEYFHSPTHKWVEKIKTALYEKPGYEEQVIKVLFSNDPKVGL